MKSLAEDFKQCELRGKHLVTALSLPVRNGDLVLLLTSDIFSIVSIHLFNQRKKEFAIRNI